MGPTGAAGTNPTGAVLYNAAQTLNGTARTQTKQNIGALGTGYQYINADTTLTASAAGNTSYVAANINVTLPPIASCQANDMFMFMAWGGQAVIKCSGSETLSYQNQNASTLTLKINQTVVVLCSGVQWLVFGLATPQDDAPSVNYSQAFTSLQRRQGRLNLATRGATIGGISAAATLTAASIGSSYYLSTGGYSITMPPVSNFGSGDSIEFANMSASTITIARSTSDTASFFCGKGLSASSLTLLPGMSVTVISDGTNFLCLSYAPALQGVPSVDFAQAFSAAQIAQLWTNSGLTGNTVQAGEVAYFAIGVAPNGWLKANGAAVSRTAYANLYAAIGTYYGNGDGSSTFNLPDLRGEFIRGFDDSRGLDNGRSIGTVQTQNMPNHYHYLPIGYDGSQIYGWMDANNSPIYGSQVIGGATRGRKAWDVVETNTAIRNSYSDSTPFGQSGENRPRNVSLLVCIKY